jgi:hypothetical protein
MWSNTLAGDPAAAMATSPPQDSNSSHVDVGDPDDPVHVRFIASTPLGQVSKCAPYFTVCINACCSTYCTTSVLQYIVLGTFLTDAVSCQMFALQLMSSRRCSLQHGLHTGL